MTRPSRRRCHGRRLLAAAERGAAEAVGRAPVPGGGSLAARAAPAAVLGLAHHPGARLAGAQHHHPARPRHQRAEHPAAGLPLPRGHRAVVVGLGTCLAVRLGTDSDLMFFSCFIGLFLFYCAHWQTYVSGSLRFAKIDVTEVQFCIMLIFFLSAIGGATLWDNEIPVLGMRMKLLPVFGIFVGAIYSCTNYFQVIFTGGMGKNGSTIAGTSVLSPASHIGLVITLAVMIYKKSTTHLFEEHPCLYVLTFGCVASKITNKLVVAHMTRSKMKLQDTAFIGPGLLFFNQYFDSFINEYFVLWIAMIWSLCDLLTFCTAVCNQIASHLHIEIFRIPQQAPEQVFIPAPGSLQDKG
ncbi:cholinephosphotransferase 1 isoform X3 [Narcine bancroftii]|uniref:cholinephosphotransferase 1 isoform X3 n=1 Tax=Narcine bancroftii TaxID=1343680 RepID=UPI003831E780